MKNTMKKVMWIISFIPLVITAVVLGFLPDKVPMHYNSEGVIDRWGSKYENLLFPIIIIALTLFWHLFIRYFEKKAIKTQVEKEHKEALSFIAPRISHRADSVHHLTTSSGRLRLSQIYPCQ